MYCIRYQYGRPYVVEPYEGGIVYHEYPFDHLIESIELDIEFFKTTLETSKNLIEFQLMKEYESKVSHIELLENMLKRLKKGHKIIITSDKHSLI